MIHNRTEEGKSTEQRTGEVKIGLDDPGVYCSLGSTQNPHPPLPNVPLATNQKKLITKVIIAQILFF